MLVDAPRKTLTAGIFEACYLAEAESDDCPSVSG